ncbi:hypothetical protein GGR50DRAFT_674401 [Xylaria sp. CBS 124048]|nr:hypothetical protein GGR50DRAFT_674401 [Xylaria sp. CBS 124048]
MEIAIMPVIFLNFFFFVFHCFFFFSLSPRFLPSAAAAAAAAIKCRQVKVLLLGFFFLSCRSSPGKVVTYRRRHCQLPGTIYTYTYTYFTMIV